MGNKESKRVSSFADWQKVQTLNGVDIYRHNHNNQLAQKRTVSLDPHFDLNDELKVYHLRQFNNDSLVRSFGALQIENKRSSNGICSGNKKIEVLTQRIPYRLSDLPQLTFAESLLFLRESLRAYSKVFRSYGPIHITKRMIGINEYGQVRCWLNQNWATNHPDHEFPTLQSTKMQGIPQGQNGEYIKRSEVYDGRYRDETEMVHNIICLIEEKCEEGKFPVAFSEQIEQYSTSFRKLTLYLQDFLSINQVFVPPKINYDTIFISKLKIKQQNGLKNQLLENKQIQNRGSIMTGQSLQNRNIFQSSNTYSLGVQYYPKQEGYFTNNSSTLGTTVTNTNLQSDRLNFFHNYSKSPSPNLTDYALTKTNVLNTFTNQEEMNKKTVLTNNLPKPNQSSHNIPTNYQNFSYKMQKPLLSSIQETNNVVKPLSIQKPIQNQSSYSSSYFQYSITNPQPFRSYNQTEILTNTDLVSKAQQIKPFSHTTLSNRLGSVSNKSNQSGNIFTTTYQVKKQIVQTGEEMNDYKNYHSLKENTYSFQPIVGNIKNIKTLEEFTNNYQNLEKNNQPQKQTYNFSQKPNTFEPSNSYNAEKSVAYSFDGRQDYNAKFTDSISKPYSNFLTNYQTVGFSNLGSNSNETKIQGKYFNQFNSLIGNSLLKDKFNISNTIYNPENQSTLTNSTQQFIYGNKNLLQQGNQQDSNTQRQTNIFQGFLKMTQPSKTNPINPIPV